MPRRAKVVCTLGPAVASREQVQALVEAGMDVARLNFSHGSHEEHTRLYRWVREAADEVGQAVAVLADLQGPKIRLGRFAQGTAEWSTGARVRITTEDVAGTAARVSTTYRELTSDVVPGDRVLIDDGNVALQVVAVEGPDVCCVVTEGGVVSDHKGMNLPGVRVTAPSLTRKDETDLRFALGLRVDLVAMSFVRSPEDAEPVRRIMADVGTVLPVLAKIEKPEAVAALEPVIDAFDGVMVARGDLGVELPLERVPFVQKRAIGYARDRAKPVIVATQMLDSMIEHSRPTRAETSDVANAVLDGADALMLSGETSVGRYPVAAVSTMVRIVETVEGEGLDRMPALSQPPRTRGGAIGRAAAQVGAALDAKALVAFTQSGETARRLARYRSPIPLLAFSDKQATRSQLALSWGVETFLVPTVDSTDEMVAQVEQQLLAVSRAAPGDTVVVVAGTPPGTPGSTNTLRVHVLDHDRC